MPIPPWYKKSRTDLPGFAGAGTNTGILTATWMMAREGEKSISMKAGFLLPPTSSRNLSALRLLAPLFLILAWFTGESAFSICIFYSITGLPCPGCGMTRSVHFLLHGDILHALRYHLFGILVLPAAFLSALTIFSARATRLYEWLEQRLSRLVWPGLILILLYAGLRIAVLQFSGSSEDGGWSSASSFFADFDGPGLFDFISGSLFKMGSL